MAVRRQPGQSIFNPRIKPRMNRDACVIGGQKQRKILLLGLRRDQHTRTCPRIARPQHGPPPLKRDGGVGHRVQPVQPAPRQNGVGGADQIARRVG